MTKTFLIIASLFTIILSSTIELPAQSNGDLFMHPYLYVSTDELTDDFDLVPEDSNQSNDDKVTYTKSAIKHVRCGTDSKKDSNNLYTPAYKTIGNYSSGDRMYVWAKSGYKLRAEPHTKSAVLNLIAFGEGITIIQKEDKRYVDKALTYVDHSFSDEISSPYIINGNWVKVKTNDGLVGYVIDQYLLSIEPKNKLNPVAYDLNIELLDKDVKIINENLEDGSTLHTLINYQYSNRINSTLEHGSNWTSTDYVLEHFTAKEAFILFSSSWGNMDDYDVLENKEDLLIVSDRNNCKISFKEALGTVLVSFDCQ